MITEVKHPNQKRLRWLNIVDPTVEELNAVAAEFNLHPTSVEDCLEPYHIVKYEKIDDVVFMISRVYDEEAHPNADSVTGLTRKLALFAGDHFVITITRKPMAFVEQMIEKWSCAHGHEKDYTKVRLILALFDEIGWSYSKLIEHAEDLVTRYEDDIFDREKCGFRIQDAYELKRKMLVVKKLLRMTSDAIRKFDHAIHTDSPYFQSVREDVDSLYFKADELVEDCNGILNIFLSLSSYHTNEIVKTLTMFSIFFLPITFIAGVYGMNFDFMPELHWGYGYAFSMGLMAVVVLFIYVYFRRKKWL